MKVEEKGHTAAHLIAEVPVLGIPVRGEQFLPLNHGGGA